MTPKKQSSVVEAIREKYGRLTMEKEPTAWLDTGHPDLNEVLGDRVLGLPFGSAIELYGMESHGKTSLAVTIAGHAQKQGAEVCIAPFEPWDARWATRRGLDTSRVNIFKPSIIKEKGAKKSRFLTAEEVIGELEDGMIMLHERGAKRIVTILDSLPAMLPEDEGDHRLEDHSMRQNMSLPVLLGKMFRRLMPVVNEYNVLFICINQMRQKPMVKFGSPWYTPGGTAKNFHFGVRAQVSRVLGSKMMQSGKQVGIRGVIKNKKNKVGGVENSVVGFKLYFDGPMEFLDATELTASDVKDEE